MGMFGFRMARQREERAAAERENEEWDKLHRVSDEPEKMRSARKEEVGSTGLSVGPDSVGVKKRGRKPKVKPPMQETAPPVLDFAEEASS